MYQCHLRYKPLDSELGKIINWLKDNIPTCRYQFLKVIRKLNLEFHRIEDNAQILELIYEEFMTKYLFKSNIVIRFYFDNIEDQTLLSLTWGNDKVEYII